MIRHSFLLCAVAAVLALPVRADEPSSLPPDLAAVPPGAIGFLHVRVAELWKGDFFKELRKTLEKAGPQAMKAFDQRFEPAPSTIERVTIIAIMPNGPAPDPPFVGVVSCSKPFNKKKMLKGLLPHGKEMKVGEVSIVADEEVELAIRVIDDRTFAIAATEVMKQFLELKAAGANPFAPALMDAAAGRHAVLALNASLIPAEAVGQLPEPLQPLARAKLAQVSVQLDKDIRVDLRLHFADEGQAKSGEGAAKDGLKMARQAMAGLKTQMENQLMPKDKKGVAPITELPEAALALAALGAIEQVDAYLKDLPLKRDGNSLAVSAVVPAGPFADLLGMSTLSAGFALPALQKARMASQRSRSANNLKQMMLAFHNYHDTNNGFPSAAICDKNGKPLLSWRVTILPYIEQDNLYKQFHLDEPWDSEHNKKLIPMMPKIYALPNEAKPGDHVTHYRAFYGNGAALELKKPVRITEFTDGTSNTLVFVEATDPVVWTKPDELEYDPNKPLPKLGKPGADGFWVAMADGSVRYVSKKIAETTLRAVITRNGGEIIGPDFE